jgi:CRISPR/Cas system CMR-associated protein Cmr5 small subunit
MKIWGNHLKVGDTIYYEYDYDIRQSTVKERDTKTFKMPSLIMENGDRLFVNDYFYTEKQEVIDNILEDLKYKCKSKLEEIDKQQNLLKFSKLVIEDKLKELDKFTI